ncbi:methyl-accepting chemotaxis protein [Halopseudomonas xiamenensis]|uniref:methyl-accepting chemotaxis protein n=1 Tax=Halopseudomonas xiamenensis TaxID=157792 RepID=UPI001F3E7F49|nr:methyl-accepting chemotaxis protein [Halopseudomonas xiamenensis]
MQAPSQTMALTERERRWLPLTGRAGKLRMGWACWLNRNRRTQVEEIFTSIAETRVRLLQQWCDNQWAALHSIAEQLQLDEQPFDTRQLSLLLRRLPDATELLLLDGNGQPLYGSAADLPAELPAVAVRRGLQQPFLHGPYVDQRTQALGPSSSSFHDAVTLMFYLPLPQGGCLCARIPNDVLGDLIQREAGHVYPESGDNYIFMVESCIDPDIEPGRALSRSRFEDNTFSHGENLKDGIGTRWGAVQVREHTELEIRFTDPATGQLHPGVRETIRHGSNLFVAYPGYADYRHIPVIGKGTTFTLQGSSDRWGMMCEADLEEVFRYRSLSYSLMRQFALVLMLIGANQYALALWQPSALVQVLLTAAVTGGGALWFWRKGTRKLARRTGRMTEIIRNIAEGEGDLRQRLDNSRLAPDETGELGRWVNSFIDNLDNIVGRVKDTSHHVLDNSERMLASNEQVSQSVTSVSHDIQQMLAMIEQQLASLDEATLTAEQMRNSLGQVIAAARQQLDQVTSGTRKIRDTVAQTADSVQLLDQRSDDIASMVSLITDITSQTNLLALNAAIEAARAGEHGRGFAVVADEVRALAARTARVAAEIRQCVDSIRDATREAVSQMQHGVAEVDQQLQQTDMASAENAMLQRSVDELFNVISQMDSNSKAHGRQVAQVAQATSAMAGVMHNLRASSVQVRETAVRLSQLSDSFRVSADQRQRFREMPPGTGATASKTPT